MAVNVQTTPEHPNRHPPGWDRILWAPKKKYTRKPIRFQDLFDDVENDHVVPSSQPRTPPNRSSMNDPRSSTTPTFDKKPLYKPVILKFDDDDEE